MPVAGVAQANINKRMNSSFLIIVLFLVDLLLTKITFFLGKKQKNFFFSSFRYAQYKIWFIKLGVKVNYILC